MRTRRQLSAPGTTLEAMDRLRDVYRLLQGYLRDADAHCADPHADVAAAAEVLADVLVPVAPGFTYQAVATDVLDGGRFIATVDLGFRVYHSCDVRVYGVSTPELHKPGGPLAQLYLQRLVLDAPLLLRSFNDELSRERWVCQVVVVRPGETPVDVAGKIIETHHGVAAHAGDVVAVTPLVD